MENQTVNTGKTTAIISHLWVIGLLISFVMNTSKKNSFASFYIRQMVGLNLLLVVNQYIIYRLLGGFACWVVGVIILILIIISLFGAIKEEEKLVPILGDKFQEWFKNI